MEKFSTTHKGSLYPADWLRIAEKDLGRVSQLLDAHDVELAAFCLQQAAEKFLKAFLLSQGWQLRRIHNLDTLLDDAVARDPSLEDFRGVCQRVTAYYFVERYPPVIETGITEDDVRNSLTQVNELAIRLRAKLSAK
jgi:HEPN domain-containing protein